MPLAGPLAEEAAEPPPPVETPPRHRPFTTSFEEARGTGNPGRFLFLEADPTAPTRIR